VTAIQATSKGDDGRPAAGADGKDVLAILQKYEGRRGSLIAILEKIQLRYGYLPEEALRAVSARTGRSLVDIYGIATFYRSFSLRPRGEHLVCACLGTACHVRGAPAIVERLQQQLGINAGETTPDRLFTLETVNCLGACALGPVVVIDGHYFSKVKKSRIRPLLDGALAGFDRTEAGEDDRLFPITASCSRCNHSLMDPACPIDGHPSIRVSILFDRQQGWLRLSSLHGSGRFSTDCDVPSNSVARFFCPYCHEELVTGSDCPVCEAPLVSLIVDGGAMLRICSRRGCEKYLLDLT
jgi:NADH-quinone oxidoreductase subunit E